MFQYLPAIGKCLCSAHSLTRCIATWMPIARSQHWETVTVCNIWFLPCLCEWELLMVVLLWGIDKGPASWLENCCAVWQRGTTPSFPTVEWAGIKMAPTSIQSVRKASIAAQYKRDMNSEVSESAPCWHLQEHANPWCREYVVLWGPRVQGGFVSPWMSMGN